MNFKICILGHVGIKKLKFTLVENFLLYRVQYLDFIFFQIKFDQSAQDLHNFIRGCDKVPGAWTTINGQVIIITFETIQLIHNKLLTKRLKLIMFNTVCLIIYPSGTISRPVIG